nr:uncharacterized protein LOC129267731 [Lytechinus pictus]
MSGQSPTQRVAKPDECDYALVQDMGEGFRRGTSKISAIGTSFTMVYGEWVAAGSADGDESPVVICIHGTPATEGAFRPLGSRLAAEGYRVLAVNFPGMGYTEMDSERRFDFSVTHKAELCILLHLFVQFAKDLTRLGERQIPVLLFYGLRDRIVEPESIPEIIDLLDIPESNIKEFNDEDEPNMTFHGDSVRRVVRFKTGTHRLHFKKTELVLEEIFSFLRVLSKKSR